MSNPSPTCEVKNGAAAYVSAVGGVDVTPAETIIIRLSSIVDVDTWSIVCATTDDESDKDTVTASLVIDADLKTATFTAPAAGKAYRFRSKVNGGIDRNGVAQTSYSTTFCIYTLLNGRRVSAADETTETDVTFGWTKWHNHIIRSLPVGSGGASWSSGGGGGGGAFAVTPQFLYYGAGGSFLGATGLEYVPTTGAASLNRGLLVKGTGVATLGNAALVAGTAATGFNMVAPVLDSPILGGTATFTGIDMKAMGLADHQPVSAVRRLLTTDATIVPVFAWKVVDEAVTNVVVEANAVPSGGAAGGSYVRRVMMRSDGGVATMGTVEASWDSEHTASGIGFTGISIGSGIYIGCSGATGFVNVRGTPTGQIKWGVTISLQHTSWA